MNITPTSLVNTILLLTASFSITSNTAPAASFNCNKAATKVEKMICDDSELSKLDDKMGSLYRQAIQNNKSPGHLMTQQIAWLKNRDKCITTECLKQNYKARNKTLSTSFHQDTSEDTGTPVAAPACAKKDAPEQCTWTADRHESYEQKIINRTVATFEKRILPHLDKAALETYATNSAGTAVREYCSKQLAAIQEGQVTYFPSTQLKSVMVGYKKLRKLREKALTSTNCDKNRLFILSQKPDDATEWDYFLPKALARMQFTHTNDFIYIRSADKTCKNVFSFGDKRITNIKNEYQAGFFIEQINMVIKINDTLFGVESGTLLMDENSPIWKDNKYSILVGAYNHGNADGYNFNPEQQQLYQQKRMWPGLVLALHPIGHFNNREQQIVDSEIPDASWNNTDIQACLWNILE